MEALLAARSTRPMPITRWGRGMYVSPISSAVRIASQTKIWMYRRSSWTICSGVMVCAAMAMLPSARALQEIDEREDEDPDEIDEVPVETGDLDLRVVLRREPSRQADQQDDAQVNDATEDVHAVKAGQDEERGAEVVLGDRLAVLDEMVPFVGLQPEERRAAENREEKKHPELAVVALSDPGERLDHRHAAA